MALIGERTVPISHAHHAALLSTSNNGPHISHHHCCTTATSLHPCSPYLCAQIGRQGSLASSIRTGIHRQARTSTTNQSLTVDDRQPPHLHYLRDNTGCSNTQHAARSSAYPLPSELTSNSKISTTTPTAIRMCQRQPWHLQGEGL